ncbi:heat shock 70 kDa protein 15-like [Dorcoceras hygrometricum]|uniref:Heat shock 70 kDa protein 15-like n=1 Tax=Dorcoceras hygrometricum TaxID=472368 RepID=A0A2Z6ZZI6_9LAMI|nr:heat shock 70 kDa protein 15-like [Dorcoceras hygrometricum]
MARVKRRRYEDPAVARAQGMIRRRFDLREPAGGSDADVTLTMSFGFVKSSRWYLKFSDSKTMSFEEVDTTAFCLHAKDSADGLCDDQTSSWTFSKANPTADDLAKQFQQRRKFSSDTGFIFSTKNSDFSTRSKILEQKTPPVEIRKYFSRVQGRIHAVRFFIESWRRELEQIREVCLSHDQRFHAATGRILL